MEPVIRCDALDSNREVESIPCTATLLLANDALSIMLFKSKALSGSAGRPFVLLTEAKVNAFRKDEFKITANFPIKIYVGCLRRRRTATRRFFFMKLPKHVVNSTNIVGLLLNCQFDPVYSTAISIL